MEKDRLYAFGEKAALPVLFLLVIPVWGAAQILNTPVICVYRFGIYGICFLLGYYVFSDVYKRQGLCECAEGDSGGGDTCVACAGCNPCGNEACGQRDPGQLADGAAFIGGKHSHRADTLRLPGLPHFKRHAGSRRSSPDAEGGSDLYGTLPVSYTHLDRFGDNPAAMRQAGIAYATDQIIDLIANGVNHVHIYTMNKPDVAGEILDNLSEIYVRA